VKIVYRDKVYELDGRMTLRDAIKKVGLRPDAVLGIRDGKLMTDDLIVEPTDTVQLIAVVSGG